MKEGQRVDTKHVGGQVALILWGQPERKAELCLKGKDCNKKRDWLNLATMCNCICNETTRRRQMIGPLIAVLCVAAPCGYLAGDVFKERHKGADWLPYACAAFLPMAAIIAAVLIIQVEVEKEDE